MPGLPFYVSPVTAITYSNAVDLAKQQDAYCQKLKEAAAKEGKDPKNFNQVSSFETDNASVCEKDRKDNITHLRTAGNIVKEVAL